MEKNLFYFLIKKISKKKNNGIFFKLNKKNFQILVTKLIVFLCLVIHIFPLKIKIIISRREKALISGRNFLNKCLEGLMIKNKTYKKYNNPKISIIIPIYNSQNTINSAIKSIQNQNNSIILSYKIFKKD